jgi:hypothetical protein
MTFPVSDSFTTDTDQVLTSYSANWSNVLNSAYVLQASDTFRGNVTADEWCARWNADTPNNDQKAQVKLAAEGNSTFVGPAVRCSSSAATYYGFYTDGNDIYLFEVINGSWSQITTSGSYAPDAGDIYRLEVEGTTLRVYENDVLKDTITNETSISSGYVGITGYNNATGGAGDDFSADNLGAAAQGLTGTKYTDGDSFGAGTVAGAAQTLTGTVYSAANSFGTNVLYRLVEYAPTSDISVSGWQTELGGSSNLYESIDEVSPNDSDYIVTTPTETPLAASFGSPASDPQTGDAHYVAYRYKKDGVGQINLTARLKEGTSTIASWTHLDIPDSWVTQEQLLSTTQANNITDYSALRVEFEVVRA